MSNKNAISQSSSGAQHKRNVLISFLTFDKDDFDVAKNQNFVSAHKNKVKNRNDLWRPAVAMARYHELANDRKLFFDKYYLFINPDHRNSELLKTITADIEAASRETKLVVKVQEFKDPYDFKTVYSYLYDISQNDEFHDPNCNYYVNCTSGTYVMRSCLFALTQEGCFPGVRIEPRPWQDKDTRNAYTPIGYYEIDDPKELSAVRHKIVTGTPTKTRKALTANIPTNNARFKQLIERIGQTVSVRINGHHIIDPILFTGATGSGKTSIVENIAEKVWGKKLYRINCAELRGDSNIAISRLFGHVENAYTDCGPAKDGVFSEANGSVLFLDEIGELPPEAQSMLLTSIEHRPGKRGYWFTKLGSSEEIKSEFQLICGTNRVLEGNPEFRQDLLARISTWHFELPSLAERRDDIPEQKQYPLDRFKDDYGVIRTFHQEAAKKFEEFAATWPWTGNFREFNDMIRRMASLSGDQILAEDVEREIKLAKQKQAAREQREKPCDSTISAPATPPPRPSGMDRLRELLGKDFDNYDVKNRILAAYLIEECEKLPRPKTQKELAERTQITEPNISRWLKACGLDFQHGIIVRRTVS